MGRSTCEGLNKMCVHVSGNFIGKVNVACCWKSMALVSPVVWLSISAAICSACGITVVLLLYTSLLWNEMIYLEDKLLQQWESIMNPFLTLFLFLLFECQKTEKQKLLEWKCLLKMKEILYFWGVYQTGYLRSIWLISHLWTSSGPHAISSLCENQFLKWVYEIFHDLLDCSVLITFSPNGLMNYAVFMTIYSCWETFVLANCSCSLSIVAFGVLIDPELYNQPIADWKIITNIYFCNLKATTIRDHWAKI